MDAAPYRIGQIRVIVFSSIFSEGRESCDMNRRQALALTGASLVTPVAGCIGLFENNFKAPLELTVFNHSNRQSHLQLYILDDDEEVLLAKSVEIDDHSSGIYEVVEEASEGDEFTVIVHETELNKSDADNFELVCPDRNNRDDHRYVLTVEVKSDHTLYIASRASCS
ncbi:hypothetical protein [Halalkaliarchaeum desulfuricum]|uniref:hypothetical protein n=1 Tax=Halalkaliarchaeum desulfuricum TaxID=2055893 RepID=UPI00105AB0F1|nr:hypothetical protein [Halalkaliarchaeum desulfuricum]